MSSCKSHENVVQGHLVNFRPGAKKKTEQEDCVPLAPTSVCGQCRRGNTANTGSGEVFAELTHQCEIALKEIEGFLEKFKKSFTKKCFFF